VNTSRKFDSLIAPLLANLGNAAMLTEVAILACIAVATWFGIRLLRQRGGGNPGHPRPPHPFRLESPDPARQPAAPGLGQPRHPGQMAGSGPAQSGGALLLSFIAIQSCFFVLRRVLKPSRALHVVERVVSWLVWIVFALHLTGYLDEVVASLDAVGFDVGKQHLSLYTLFVGLLSLTTTLMVALWLAHMPWKAG
jgi:hypothetical protein